MQCLKYKISYLNEVLSRQGLTDRKLTQSSYSCALLSSPNFGCRPQSCRIKNIVEGVLINKENKNERQCWESKC